MILSIIPVRRSDDQTIYIMFSRLILLNASEKMYIFYGETLWNMNTVESNNVRKEKLLFSCKSCNWRCLSKYRRRVTSTAVPYLAANIYIRVHTSRRREYLPRGPVSWNELMCVTARINYSSTLEMKWAKSEGVGRMDSTRDSPICQRDR